jgi:hypothetical protein
MEKIINITPIKEYLKWLYKEYKSIFHGESTNTFKLISEDISKKTGETIFKIQFVGKHLCFKMTTQELSADPKILNKFSPIDQLTIKNVLNKSKKVNQTNKENCSYKLISIDFDKRYGTPLCIFLCKKNGKEYYKKLTTNEIKENRDFLMKLSDKDIESILLLIKQKDR